MPVNRRAIRNRRNLLLAAVAVVAVASAASYAAYWLLVGRFWVVTDNAFVTGNLIPVYSDATGVVSRVFKEETEHVEAGEPLMALDQQRAEAILGQAEGELGRAVRNVGALFAARRQTCQKIASRRALLDKVRHDVARYRQALTTGSVSKQVMQNAEDQMAALEADVQEARAELRSSDAKVSGATRKRHPEIEAAKAKFSEAYIEFARQRIRAPVSGTVAKRKAQVGLRVKPGDQLLTIVPLDHLWVEANLWESSLRQVRPGQPVRVTVDLYGRSQIYHGAVDGLVPGTGSVFALLPPDNATGNFIHIVQRVPVRISLRADELAKQPLRPGLSTVVAIDVRDAERSPNAALTEVSAKEYETSVFRDDLAEARKRAEKIVDDNLFPRGDEAEAPCALGE
jgi:membrane fusion protein (multidrug efflux system)